MSGHADWRLPSGSDAGQNSSASTSRAFASRPVHDAVRGAERRQPCRGSVSRPRGNSAPPLSGTGPSVSPERCSGVRRSPAGLDVVIVPRREMLDAPFASLEADYHAALDRRDRAASEPRRRAAGRASRSSSGCYAAYKLLISPLFTGCCRFQPSCSDYMAEAVATHGAGRGRLARACVDSSRCHPLGRPRVRPGPPRVECIHGTQGLRRHHPCRSSCCTAIRRSSCRRHRRQTVVRTSNAAPAAGSAEPAAAGARQRRPRRPSTEPARLSRAAAVTGEAAEREIVVETADVEVVLTNRGGRVLALAPQGLPRRQRRAGRSGPVGVPAGSADALSRCASTTRTVTKRLNDALYRVSGDTGGRVDATKRRRDGVVRVRRRGGPARAEGVPLRSAELRRDVSPRRSRAARARSIRRSPGDRASATSARDLGGGSFFTGNYVQPPQAIYHRDGNVERVAAGKLAEQPAHEGQFRFAGIDDHYFLAAAVNPGQARVEFRSVVAARSRRQARSDSSSRRRSVSATAAGRAVLRRSEAVRPAASRRSGAGARDQLRHVRLGWSCRC